MDNELKKLCKEKDVDPKVIKKIIQIEKENVHKKRREIFGDLRKIIDESIKSEGDFNDFQ